MVNQDNVSEFLTPELVEQVQPILNAAIDMRIEPLSQKLEQIAQGVQLLAQAQLELTSQAQQPQATPQAPQPTAMPVETPTGFAYPQQAQAPMPMMPQAQPQTQDKLAAMLPLIMQYLTNQNGTPGNNLNGIAETLGVATQIGNAMNAPMINGIKMATDMMTMAGRAGIEPVVAAETLGSMAHEATHTAQNGHRDPTAG